MFIFTAKFNKKKAIIGLLLLAAVLCTVIIVVGNHNSKSSATSAFGAVVKNNDERVEFLQSLGWEVSAEPIDEQTVIIPREFTDVYEDYNNLQKSQGFDLSKFGGIEAIRYTYAVANYPGHPDRVVADIIIYRGQIIAGNIQSTALDGFMQSLEFPKE